MIEGVAQTSVDPHASNALTKGELTNMGVRFVNIVLDENRKNKRLIFVIQDQTKRKITTKQKQLKLIVVEKVQNSQLFPFRSEFDSSNVTVITGSFCSKVYALRLKCRQQIAVRGCHYWVAGLSIGCHWHVLGCPLCSKTRDFLVGNKKNGGHTQRFITLLQHRVRNFHLVKSLFYVYKFIFLCRYDILSLSTTHFLLLFIILVFHFTCNTILVHTFYIYSIYISMYVYLNMDICSI
jgi:hypothetical protein